MEHGVLILVSVNCMIIM